MRKKKQFRKKKKKEKLKRATEECYEKGVGRIVTKKIYIYYMLREGNQSLFPSHSHLLQVKAVKAA